jgi:hypothetical protein
MQKQKKEEYFNINAEAKKCYPKDNPRVKALAIEPLKLPKRKK